MLTWSGAWSSLLRQKIMGQVNLVSPHGPEKQGKSESRQQQQKDVDGEKDRLCISPCFQFMPEAYFYFCPWFHKTSCILVISHLLNQRKKKGKEITAQS